MYQRMLAEKEARISDMQKQMESQKNHYDDDEKEETQTNDAFYLKRWEQHVKYIHAATDRK